MSVITLQWTLLAVAGGMLFLWIVFALVGPRRNDVPSAIVEMRYGSLLQMFALLLALAPPTLMACVVWLWPWPNEQRLLVAGASFLATSVIAALPLIDVIRTVIVVSEDGVTRYSPWSGQATLRWADIQSVRYSTLNRWFVLRGPAASIRVSRHLTGWKEFAHTLQRKLARERWQGWAAMLDAFV